MVASPTLAIDLLLKALVWQDVDGHGGAPHGLRVTLAEPVNEDWLSFLKS
jgi:hypothetical protein